MTCSQQFVLNPSVQNIASSILFRRSNALTGKYAVFIDIWQHEHVIYIIQLHTYQSANTTRIWISRTLNNKEHMQYKAFSIWLFKEFQIHANLSPLKTAFPSYIQGC